LANGHAHHWQRNGFGFDEGLSETDFEWLKWRMIALIARGDLEIQEKRSPEEMHLAQVRLARTQQSMMTTEGMTS